MNSIKEEEINGNIENSESNIIPKVKRRSYKIQTQKSHLMNLESLYKKVGKVKQRYSLSVSNRMDSLIKLTSSKMIGVIKKPSKGFLDDVMIPDLIDPTYNFSMNYQLKETAIKIFQSGLEEDKTKIKFFCFIFF